MLSLGDNVPQTISTSYGEDEQTGESLSVLLLCDVALDGCCAACVRTRPALTCGRCSFSVPKEYALRVCKEFATLGKSYFVTSCIGAYSHCLCAGSRGTSIIFSSGDGGVGDGNPDPATQQCIPNDGTNQTRFLPHFPASCPLCVVFRVPYVFLSHSSG